MGSRALVYLRGRGLQDETIKRFHLGFNLQGRKIDGKFWLDHGITIPGLIHGELWYLKVRRPQGDPKYRCMTGSSPAAIYNADALAGASMALFCEGEFDCMIASQEFGDILPAVTLGSSDNMPDLATWGPYLLPLRLLMTTYDSDEAGEKGAAALHALVGERSRPAPLPEGAKDINDYYLAGGDLLAWLVDWQHWYSDPIFQVA